MAISFVAVGTRATGANPTPTMPAGYAIGDLLIAFANCDTAVASAFGAIPNGWAQLYNQTTLTNTPAQVIYKIAQSTSETAPAFVQASTTAVAQVIAYRGVGAIDVTTQTVETTNTGTHTTSSVTTTNANDWIISIFQGETTTALAAWTTPASTTLREYYGGNGSTIANYLIVDEIQASAGASTTRSSSTTPTLQATKTVIALREANTTVALVNTSSAVQNTNSTTITINVPSGVANGDLMVMGVASFAASYTTPTGWNVWLATTNSRVIYYRYASSEPASYTVTAGSSTTSDAWIIVYRNAQIDAIGTISASGSPTVLSAITTTANNAYVFASYSATTGGANTTYTIPTGYTGLVSDGDATAPNFALFYTIQATAGTTGTVSSTPSNAPTSRGVLFSIIPPTASTVNSNFFFMMGM